VPAAQERSPALIGHQAANGQADLSYSAIVSSPDIGQRIVRIIGRSRAPAWLNERMLPAPVGALGLDRRRCMAFCLRKPIGQEGIMELTVGAANVNPAHGDPEWFAQRFK
jgi:hypothetical protein